MTKGEIYERIADIEQNRRFYEEQGIDVEKLLDAEKQLLRTSPSEAYKENVPWAEWE